jgi:hypothetical protein
MANLPARFSTLKTVIEKIAGLPGSVAEVGVWRGKGAKFLAQNLPERTIHLFDTFAGMPREDILEIDGDIWDRYEHNALKHVKAFLSAFEGLQFHPGVFPDTGSEISPSERFCLVSIDVDIHKPTLAACEFFYPRMVPGGVMVLNDYNCSKCKGATLAINNFFADKPEDVIFNGVERTWLVKS